MRSFKAIAFACLLAGVISKRQFDSENEQRLSVDLRATQGIGKNTHLIDRTFNKRSSDKPSRYQYFRDIFFGESERRTEFDFKVDAHVDRLKRENAQRLHANKKLRATTIDHDINYAVTLPMFLGEIRVGSDQSIIDAVYDTGSDWLVVPDLNCTNCDGSRIDNSNEYQTDDELSERLYGSAALKGYTYEGKVCLTSSRSSCVEKFGYFSFVEQTGINDPIEGILGMSQNKQMIVSTQEMEIGPLFANELYMQENVPTPSFSFGMLGYQDEESAVVDFGEPDEYRVEGRVIDDTTTVTFGFNDDFFWSTYTQAIRFSETSAFAIEGAPYTIFDTGSSHIMVPPLLLEPIINGIMAAAGGEAQYAVQQGVTFVDCNQRKLFKPIEWMYSEYYLVIEPEYYIWDAYNDGTVCTLLIMANSYDFFLLGQPIYQGYYTMHDMHRSTIAYAPLRGMDKPVPQRAEIPTEVMQAIEPPSFMEEYGSILFLVACVAIAVLVIHPILEVNFGWDVNKEEDQYKFIAVYVTYGIFCLAVYIFIIQPLFGVPDLDLGETRFHVAAFFSSLYGGFRYNKASAAKKLQAKPAAKKATKKVVKAKPAKVSIEANSLI